MTSTFFIYMFMLGLGTSLHCVSMCGPLVLTYAIKGTEDGPWYRKLTPNAAYQGAKITSYMLVGLLLGTIGSVLDIDAIRPYIMFLAGAFMIVLGLGMTGKVRWAARLTPRPPRALMNALSKLRRKSSADAEAGEANLATPVFFGLMTGLLPCGPLMAAQVSAAASGSPLAGAFGMALFGLGTAPLMLVFGTAGSLIPMRWKSRLMTALAVGVMIFGLVFINRGLMLTGAPVNFNTVKASFTGGQVAEKTDDQYTTAADGIVEVPLVIENTQFSPGTVQIPADKPVRLVVERREDNACSDQLALPQLGILVDLAPNGVTTVDVPATKAGTYTLTCGMGMMSGQLAVGSAAAQNSSPVPWLVLAVAAAGGALYYVRRRDALAAAEAAKKVSSKGKKGSKAGSHGPPARGSAGVHPQPGSVLGLKPQELIYVGAAIAAAVMAGLAAGGFFR